MISPVFALGLALAPLWFYPRTSDNRISIPMDRDRYFPVPQFIS